MCVQHEQAHLCEVAGLRLPTAIDVVTIFVSAGFVQPQLDGGFPRPAD